MIDLDRLDAFVAELDKRFVRIGQRIPDLVCAVHRVPGTPVHLLDRSPPGTRRAHDVAWLVHPDAPGGEPLALCVEWQTRADPAMPRRIARYLIDLPVPAGTPVAAAVVYAILPPPAERRGEFSLVGPSGRLSFRYEVLALPSIPWQQLVAARWPVLAMLAPAARGGTSPEALRASLRMLHAHFATHRESSALVAFHYLLAELRSAKEAWIMAASTEDIPFAQQDEPEGIWKWARQRLEAEHLDGHARGLVEGRIEGRLEGREALLGVARAALEADDVRRLEAIDDLGALQSALIAALSR